MTEQQTQLLDEAFERWWHQEGSEMPPLPGEEQVEHVKRISRIAWHNGSCVKFHNIPTTTQENN